MLLLVLLSGTLLLMLLPDLLLSGLVYYLAALGLLVVFAGGLFRPAFAAGLVPRGLSSPRLFFVACRLLLPFSGFFSPRLLLKFVALLLPAPPNVARGPLLPVARSGTSRSGCRR